MIPIQLNMSVATSAVEFLMSGEVNIIAGVTTYYDGDYEYTPTQNTQTIPIENMVARQNIVINPIPSNYGLITWNGSFLTVS